MIEVRAAPPEHYEWLARKASLVISAGFKALEAVDGDQILAMVGYDGWTPNSCSMHVAVDDPYAVLRLIRPAFGLVFDPPPRGFGKGVVLGSVLSTNSKALVFDRKLGFRQVARLKDVWQPGVDLILFEMRREDCRWLR